MDKFLKAGMQERQNEEITLKHQSKETLYEVLIVLGLGVTLFGGLTWQPWVMGGALVITLITHGVWIRFKSTIKV